MVINTVLSEVVLVIWLFISHFWCFTDLFLKVTWLYIAHITFETCFWFLKHLIAFFLGLKLKEEMGTQDAQKPHTETWAWIPYNYGSKCLSHLYSLNLDSHINWDLWDSGRWVSLFVEDSLKLWWRLCFVLLIQTVCWCYHSHGSPFLRTMD